MTVRGEDGSGHGSAADGEQASIDEVIAECIRLEDAGETVDREAILSRHPRHSSELEEFFANRDRIRRIAKSLRETETPESVLATIRYFGDYELIEEIARGGMGVVYRARQVSLNRTVAVKMILAGELASEEDVKRFRAEAEAAARLQHPNIVAIHEVGSHEGQHYFSMEYVEGRSLAELLRGGPLAPRQAAEHVLQVAQAVQYAHDQGTLHRDLKPSNVLLDGAGRVRLTDFGLAKRVEEKSDLTASGQVLGTPSYMPPEQAAARHGEIGPASDVYAMGAILYELLTGRPPFRAATPVETLRQVLDRDAAPPGLLNPGVPRDLETICLRCLEKEPHRRYPTALELAADAARWLRGEPILARRSGALERAFKWARRRPAVASLAAISTLATLLLVTALIVSNVLVRRALEGETRAKNELAVQQIETSAALSREGEAKREAERVSELYELALRELLGSADRGAGRGGAVQQTLAGLGKDIVPVLLEGLADENALVRSHAAEVLGRIGKEAQGAVPHLVRLLRDPDAPVRRHAARALGEIGSGEHGAVSALSARLIEDDDQSVRREAADALARMGPLARPAVGALIKALRNDADYVCEGVIAALGVLGDAALSELVDALGSNERPFQNRAVRAVAGIGSDAVPALMAASRAEERNVRENAVTALGLIGPGATDSIPALADRLRDLSLSIQESALVALGRIGEAAVPEIVNVLGSSRPVLRLRAAELLREMAAASRSAIHALEKAAGCATYSMNERSVYRAVLAHIRSAAEDEDQLARLVFRREREDWPMEGGSPSRNLVNTTAENIPERWDVETGENIKWSVRHGTQSYGTPVIAEGRILLGTNNGAGHDPRVEGDKGILLCLGESDGRVLWQATHDKLEEGRVHDWPEQGIASTPVVENGAAYYVSNRAELVCVDLEAFGDGENDGPYTEERYLGERQADFIWIYDMMELGVFPHNLARSSPLIVGDLVFVVTSNGVDRDHFTLPSPRSPSFIALDKKSGQLAWSSSAPGENILHGQWSAPAFGVAGGRPQVIFPGGDGWLRSFEPLTGKLIWKFDCNPSDSVWELGRGTRNNLVATPVFYGDTVYIGVGQEPEHGEGEGHLYAIRADGEGDVTHTKRTWHLGGVDFGRTTSAVAVHDDLVYAADLGGRLYCLERNTGRPRWDHDMASKVWGSPTVIDGKVFLGDEDGDVVVIRCGEKEVFGEYNMNNSVYSTPVAAHGVLYIATRTHLFAVAEPEEE